MGAVYLFELRKIINRRIVWAACAVSLAVCILAGLSGVLGTSYSSENNKPVSGYEMMLEQREYARALSGRAAGNALLSEMHSAADAAHAKEYTSIYTYVLQIVKDSNLVMKTDEAALYDARLKNISEIWKEQMLTENEIRYWEEKEKAIDTPFIYHYAKGWENVLSIAYALNIILFLFVPICLGNVFSIEHLRRTDQLILCTRYGKTQLYLAKILAGITFSVIWAAVLFSAGVTASILLYGADGFDAALQLALPMSSRPVSIGTAVIILFVLYLIASVLYSIASMFLSEWLNNSTAVIAVLTGFMVFTVSFEIAYWIRPVSQFYSLLPTKLLAGWELEDSRLVSVFGSYLTNFQFAAVCYIIISVILILAGKRIYRKYQVNGG